MASDVDTSSSKRRGALSPVAKELLAGTVGGCLGIIAGQPLDTVKVCACARADQVFVCVCVCPCLYFCNTS